VLIANMSVGVFMLSVNMNQMVGTAITQTINPTNGGCRQIDRRIRLLRARSAFYRELFAQTGGVPVPGDASDGALINHPDTGLAGPALNTSAVAW
jgi:uncharacterized protein (DUF3084 family)